MNYKNAVILLLTGRNYNRIMLVRNRFNKRWMTPGGIIDDSDISPFHAALRKFNEDTGLNIRKSDRKIIEYNYRNNTAIYIIFSKRRRFKDFQPTDENDKLFFPKLKDVLNGNFRPVRTVVMSSLKEMIKDKII